MAMKVTENTENAEAQGIQSPTRPRLLTIKQAALYMGRGTDSLREMVYRGVFPVIQEGERSKIWIDLQDIDNWIDSKKEYMRQPEG